MPQMSIKLLLKSKCVGQALKSLDLIEGRLLMGCLTGTISAARTVPGIC